MPAAGSDDRVAGLVYISALAPDELETSQALEEKQIVWATAMTQRHPASAWRSSQAPRVQ